MPAQRGFCRVWSRDRMRRGVNLTHGRTRRSAPTHNVRSTRAFQTFVRKAGQAADCGGDESRPYLLLLRLSRPSLVAWIPGRQECQRPLPTGTAMSGGRYRGRLARFFQKGPRPSEPRPLLTPQITRERSFLG